MQCEICFSIRKSEHFLNTQENDESVLNKDFKENMNPEKKKSLLMNVLKDAKVKLFGEINEQKNSSEGYSSKNPFQSCDNNEKDHQCLNLSYSYEEINIENSTDNCYRFIQRQRSLKSDQIRGNHEELAIEQWKDIVSICKQVLI